MEYIDLLPGFVQGVVRVCISYPFDYLRIFKQMNVNLNYFEEIKKVLVFRGIMFPIITVPIDRAITFSIFEKMKQRGYSSFESSVYPSVLSACYMTPINLLNTNYIYMRTKPIKTILAENFNRQIFRGLGVEVTRNIFSSTLYLFTYTCLSDIQKRPFVNGALSSFIMWSILYPLDTIKVHKFVKHMSYSDILRYNSVRSLYNGISLLYLRTIPSAGIGMIVYENTKKYVNSLKSI
jgi:hypothetical protein